MTRQALLFLVPIAIASFAGYALGTVLAGI